MYTPTRDESPNSYLRRSWRLIRKAKPIVGITEPMAQLEAAVTSFENRYNEWVLARHQASISLGEQHEAEEALAEQLRGVGLALLTVARGRRGSEVYHRYFPDGYGKTLRLPAQDALATAAGLLVAMSDETIPVILAWREPLATAQAGLASALAARQAAVNVVAETRAILEEEKSAWRIAYVSFYFAMRITFPDRRRWLESLFKVNGRRQPDEGATDANDATTVTTSQEAPALLPPHAAALVLPRASGLSPLHPPALVLPHASGLVLPALAPRRTSSATAESAA